MTRNEQTRRQALIQALGHVQNHPMYAHQDIMTICGFMTDDEILEHLETNLRGVANYSEGKYAA